MPAVGWTYRAMCKDLSAEMIRMLKSRDETIRAERSPNAKIPTVWPVREEPNEGIMRLQEAI